MNIYITDKEIRFTEEQIKLLRSNCKSLNFIESKKEITKYLEDDTDKILAIDPDYFDWNFKNEYIDKIKSVKAICLDTTSYSWIDLNYCKQKKIPVTNVPKYSTDAVSEYAIFMMLSIARKFPLQIKSKFKLDYNDEMLMTQLKNKTVGIIGLGTIGNNIARLCKTFGMNVIYWSNNTKNEEYKYVLIDSLFKDADFIIPTFIVNDDTKKIITDDLINSMKSTASIINILNEGVLNHELVLRKVKNNELYGYAFENNDDDIYKYEGNVLITSAYAWYTKEALENLQQIWVDSIISVCKNNIINIVN